MPEPPEPRTPAPSAERATPSERQPSPDRPTPSQTPFERQPSPEPQARSERPAPPERADDLHLDARNLRGLAHPLRVRLLGLLRTDGPSTATALAARLGLTSAATSYHLRQLATYGFIVEDTGRGQPRERWWRAAHRSTSMSLAEVADDPAAIEAGEVYLRGVAQSNAALVQGHLDELAVLPARWRAAGALNDVLLRLTPEQTDELVERMWAVVEDYPRADEPGTQAAGTRRVNVQLQVFPRPGDPIDETDADDADAHPEEER
ncbi:MAG TPA: helix-turn-helix domain-containing protein [Actinomycetales bacterium]|nr:helix-turn-helix domain-containing protein [Actinomycetales bacterium]